MTKEDFFADPINKEYFEKITEEQRKRRDEYFRTMKIDEVIEKYNISKSGKYLNIKNGELVKEDNVLHILKSRKDEIMTRLNEIAKEKQNAKLERQRKISEIEGLEQLITEGIDVADIDEDNELQKKYPRAIAYLKAKQHITAIKEMNDKIQERLEHLQERHEHLKDTKAEEHSYKKYHTEYIGTSLSENLIFVGGSKYQNNYYLTDKLNADFLKSTCVRFNGKGAYLAYVCEDGLFAPDENCKKIATFYNDLKIYDDEGLVKEFQEDVITVYRLRDRECVINCCSNETVTI